MDFAWTWIQKRYPSGRVGWLPVVVSVWRPAGFKAEWREYIDQSAVEGITPLNDPAQVVNGMPFIPDAIPGKIVTPEQMQAVTSFGAARRFLQRVAAKPGKGA